MIAFAALVATAATVGVLVLPASGPTRGLAARLSTATPRASSDSALQVPVAATAAAQVGAPLRVSVPRLKIDSALQSLALQPDGTLASPSQWQIAGWYAAGPRPGQLGPAVIAGHVDSTAGPAVFYQLPRAQVGDDVVVTDNLGTARHFTVIEIDQYPKDKFPSQAVYGPAAVPTLRLITCYGVFDEASHSYRDNLVVTAVLAG
jgi:sortase (surface protein transpeptidase)